MQKRILTGYFVAGLLFTSTVLFCQQLDMESKVVLTPKQKSSVLAAFKHVINEYGWMSISRERRTTMVMRLIFGEQRSAELRQHPSVMETINTLHDAALRTTSSTSYVHTGSPLWSKS